MYTLQDLTERALLMDTISLISALAAMLIGIEHLQYLRKHNLLRRAVRDIGIGILIAITIVVWHFGF